MTSMEIRTLLQSSLPEAVTHPALQRVAERLRSESTVLATYSRMHHRHNKSMAPHDEPKPRKGSK